MTPGVGADLIYEQPIKDILCENTVKIKDLEIRRRQPSQQKPLIAIHL